MATIAPFSDLARRIGGARCEVQTLVPAGASAHTWEPRPRDAARLAKADLFFEVGLGYEAWVEKLVGADRHGFVIVDGSEGLDLIEEMEENGEHHAGAANPHYWLDPLSMREPCARLAAALARLDPEDRDGYTARARQTGAELEALDCEIRARTAGLAERRLVTFHPAWDYFARRYGLTVLAAIEPSPGKEPGPRYVAQIVRMVRENRVRAVFAEPQFPSKAAEAIAQECGVKVFTLDPIGGERMPGREDYVSMMRYNVSVMEEALR